MTTNTPRQVYALSERNFHNSATVPERARTCTGTVADFWSNPHESAERPDVIGEDAGGREPHSPGTESDGNSQSTDEDSVFEAVQLREDSDEGLRHSFSQIQTRDEQQGASATEVPFSGKFGKTTPLRCQHERDEHLMVYCRKPVGAEEQNDELGKIKTFCPVGFELFTEKPPVKALEEYSNKEKVGEGAYGVVRRVEDSDGTEKAVKICLGGIKANEVICMFRLRNTPVVPKLHYVIWESKRVEIHQEFIKGKTFENWIKLLTSNDEYADLIHPFAIRVEKEGLEQLEKMQEEGICHSDLHGRNVMVESQPDRLKVRLVDLGKSKDCLNRENERFQDFLNMHRLCFSWIDEEELDDQLQDFYTRLLKLGNEFNPEVNLKEYLELLKDGIQEITERYPYIWNNMFYLFNLNVNIR